MPRSSELLTTYESEQILNIDRAARRLFLLSEVSRRLSFALSDQECFRQLLELMVPYFADWATITLIDDRGEIWRAASAHADPAKRAVLASVGNRYPPRLDDEVGPGAVIRDRKTEFYANFEPHLEEHLRKVRHPELSALARTLGIQSEICVPIEAYGRGLGALLLVRSISGRRFDPEDLRTAEEVANRAALSAYHLKRYETANQELERLREEFDVREEYISQVRHDVLSILTTATLSAQIIERKSSSEENSSLARRIVVAIEKVSVILGKTKTVT